MKKKHILISLLGLLAIAIAGAFLYDWWLQRTNERRDAVTAPDALQKLSNSQLLEYLSSGDSIVLANTFTLLELKADPFAVQKAEPFLKNKDENVWLTAAMYLGACKDPASVPYLIKGFRHTAWRSDSRRLQYLREITDKDFGTNFVQWKTWWEDANHNAAFDWNSSLGPSPRNPK